MKKLFIISGCNGAGKTTAATTLLPTVFEQTEFVNADNIARRLSPSNPDAVALEAGRIMLGRIEELMRLQRSFTIETTLSTRSYANLIRKAHSEGYAIVLLFFWLNSPELAIQRVAARVQEGGHNIPVDVIIRRYKKGIQNLFNLFIPLSDLWYIYDNSYAPRVQVAHGIGDRKTVVVNEETFKMMRHYGQQ